MNGSNSSSTLESEASLSLTILTSVVCGVGLVLNISHCVILFTMSPGQSLITIINHLVMKHLSALDLIQVMTVFAHNAIQVHREEDGEVGNYDWLCVVFFVIWHLCRISQPVILMVTAVDRYLICALPNWYSSAFFTRCAGFIFLLVYGLAFLLAISFRLEFYFISTHDANTCSLLTEPSVYSLITMTIVLFLPTAVTMSLFGAANRLTARKSSLEASYLRVWRRTLLSFKLLVALSVSLSICWIPKFLYEALHAQPLLDLSHLWLPAVLGLLVSNIVQPAIIFWMSHRYRMFAKKILCKRKVKRIAISTITEAVRQQSGILRRRLTFPNQSTISISNDGSSSAAN